MPRVNVVLSDFIHIPNSEVELRTDKLPSSGASSPSLMANSCTAFLILLYNYLYIPDSEVKLRIDTLPSSGASSTSLVAN